MAIRTTEHAPRELPVRRLTAEDDVSVVLHHAARAFFGALAVSAEVLARGLAESTPASAEVVQRRTAAANDIADVILGLGWRASHVSNDAFGLAFRVASPAVSFVLDPPLVATRFTPRRLLRRLTVSWSVDRADAIRSFSSLSQTVTPVAVGVVDGLVQPDALVLQVLERIDLDPVAEALITKLDLDRLVTVGLADLDVESLVQQLLATVNLTAVVENVLSDIDLDRAISASLERLDLTAVLLEHMDMAGLVEGLLGRLDITRLVLDNVDIVALADAVIEGVDLPRIVRESSGSIATETVDSIRLQGIDADRAVARLVDRLLLRRKEGR
jgi:hypothetical protein